MMLPFSAQQERVKGGKRGPKRGPLPSFAGLGKRGPKQGPKTGPKRGGFSASFLVKTSQKQGSARLFTDYKAGKGLRRPIRPQAYKAAGL